MTDQTTEGTVLGVSLDNRNQQIVENYVEALVGDGKKYKSVEELAKAYINADMHINELKTSLDELKKKDGSLDEIVNLLRNQPVPPAPGPQPPARSEPPAQTLKPEDITKSVETVLNEREKKNKIEFNKSESMRLLGEKYGSEEGAVLALKKVINGDATIREVVDRLGSSNPEALLKFMASQLPELTDGPNTPGALGKPSAAAVLPTGKGLTWSGAQQIRKDNPKLYKSPAFRAQLEQAAAAAAKNGIDFYKT